VLQALSSGLDCCNLLRFVFPELSPFDEDKRTRSLASATCDLGVEVLGLPPKMLLYRRWVCSGMGLSIHVRIFVQVVLQVKLVRRISSNKAKLESRLVQIRYAYKC